MTSLLSVMGWWGKLSGGRVERFTVGQTCSGPGGAGWRLNGSGSCLKEKMPPDPDGTHMTAPWTLWCSNMKPVDQKYSLTCLHSFKTLCADASQVRLENGLVQWATGEGTDAFWEESLVHHCDCSAQKNKTKKKKKKKCHIWKAWPFALYSLFTYLDLHYLVKPICNKYSREIQVGHHLI